MKIEMTDQRTFLAGSVAEDLRSKLAAAAFAHILIISAYITLPEIAVLHQLVPLLAAVVVLIVNLGRLWITREPASFHIQPYKTKINIIAGLAWLTGAAWGLIGAISILQHGIVSFPVFIAIAVVSAMTSSASGGMNSSSLALRPFILCILGFPIAACFYAGTYESHLLGFFFTLHLCYTWIQAGKNAEQFIAGKTQEFELWQSQEAQKTSNLLFASILNGLDDQVTLKDQNGRYRMVNKAAADFMGLKTTDIEGKLDSELLDDKTYQMVRAADLQVQEFLVKHVSEVSIHTPAGERILSRNVYPYYGISKKPVGLLCVNRDITLLKKSETELEEARLKAERAASAKSEFLANMSHEIRTPLNGVIGLTGVLLESKLDDEQRLLAETVKNSADSLLVIINDVLDISKIEAGKLDLETIDFDANSLPDDIVQLMGFAAQKKNLQLIIKADSALQSLVLRGDPSRVRQILLNLVNNAIKFTSHGEVALSSRLTESSGERHRIRYEVRDSGIGISKESMASLFSPFTQADSTVSRKFGGTGLGLSISKSLTHLLGGEIGVESRPGVGSIFWVEIPYLTGTRTETKLETPRALVTHAKSLRLLVVDDNSVNQMVALRMLKKLGIRADAVANGLEALQSIQQIDYDLILMDCHMPELDGYEATRRIRGLDSEKLRHLPVIAMTANAMPSDREKCAAAGMNNYLSKPMKIEMLANIINEELERKRSHPAA